MDLPSTEWVRHVERKWTELGPAERQRFSALTESDEVFHYGLSLIHAEDLRTLSTISEKFSVEKSPEKSPELRQQGNLSFRSRDYTTAALLYSTAICHADRTEEISLCYANRSAALFHLGLHKDCLEDIQAALEAGYPSHLREKLSCRQTACLKQLQLDRPKAKSSTPETSLYARHSSCITVHFSPKKGRHVLASESQKAGEVMLEDEAFCFVLVPGLTLNTTAGGPDDTQDRHCHHCLGRTLRLVPCPSCSFARYCGESCQKDAWHRWHQWECKTGAELLACGVLAHLSLRVTVRAGQTEILMARASVSPTETCAQRQAHDTTLKRKTSALKENFADLTRSHHGNSYLSIYGLLPHVAHHPPSLRFLLAITVAALCKKMQNGPLPDVWPSAEDGLSGSRESQMSLLGATALRHMMQLRCNAQAVTAVNVNDNSGRSVQYSSEVRIATAIFPILSLLNHSCRPNTSVSFTTGNKTLCGSEGKPEHRSSCFGSVSVTVRASRRLTAGEEILHCYGPHSSRMAVKERQRLLLDQYFFLCDCQACQKDLTDESSNAEVPKASGLKCVKCGRPVMVNGMAFPSEDLVNLCLGHGVNPVCISVSCGWIQVFLGFLWASDHQVRSPAQTSGCRGSAGTSLAPHGERGAGSRYNSSRNRFTVFGLEDGSAVILQTGRRDKVASGMLQPGRSSERQGSSTRTLAPDSWIQLRTQSQSLVLRELLFGIRLLLPWKEAGADSASSLGLYADSVSPRDFCTFCFWRPMRIDVLIPADVRTDP